jgi:CBS domain-containing protein
MERSYGRGEMRTGIKVNETMSEDIVYVTVPGYRDDVLEVFKQRGISGVPVMKEGELIGIVTRVDLLEHPDEEQIALIMKRDPITIGPDESIEEAARLILEQDIRRLPVVEDGTLVGVITTADIIRVIADLDLREDIGRYVQGGVVAIWEETPLSVAGRIMELAHIGAAPVLNVKEELVGIITDIDLINAAVIEESIEHSDMSVAPDEDSWVWKCRKNTMKVYYGVSKIKLPDIPAKEVMIKNLVTAFMVSEVSECATQMAKNKLDQIPITASNRRLIGLLRDKDLLKALV